MFKKRSVLLSVVDDPKSNDARTPRWPHIDYKEINKEATRSVSQLVGAYILADTARKIAIHIAEAKIR
jgi:hypothetical protein